MLLISTACVPARANPEATTASPPQCDDRVDIAPAIPPEMAAYGVTRAVGSGDTWFFAPMVDHWSSSVQTEGEGYQLKIGMWMATPNPPDVTVREVDGGQGNGSTTFGPTASGLPGPLPSSAHFPTAGCWEIVARGTTGSAFARVHLGAST